MTLKATIEQTRKLIYTNNKQYGKGSKGLGSQICGDGRRLLWVVGKQYTERVS